MPSDTTVTPAEARNHPSPLAWTLAGLALPMLLAALGTSIANVGLPVLAEVFGVPMQAIQWVVLAYLLAVTSLVVGAGRLGDLVGRRRLLLGGIALFVAGSAFAAAAPALPWLVAARATQGAGAAMMMALSMAFVGDVVPKERTGAAMGLLGSASAIGTALGPSLGGVLIGAFGWRSLFVATLLPGLLALGLAWRALPADRERGAAKGFDVTGTLLLAATLASYALAMTLGRGSFGLANIALLLVAAVGLAMFGRVQTRAAAPLIGLTMLRDPALRAGLVATALVSAVMMATLVVGPFHLTQGLGLDVARAGLVMSAGPLVAALAGVPSGRIVDRVGARRATLAGLGAILAGAVGFCVMPLSFGVGGYVAPLVVATAGYALFQAANNTVVMREVPTAQRGVVSGLLNLARNLGLVTGASLIGAVYAGVAATAGASGAVMGLRATFALAALLVLGAILVIARRA